MAWSWENAGGGAMAGAAIGGTAGTMVMPGVGTAVGAVGGGLIGGVLGGMGGLGGIMDNMQGVVNADAGSGAQHLQRDRQLTEQNVLSNWAMTGNGPSAAQQLLQQNRAQNAAQQIGMAKSMPGGNAALANQLAAEGIARGSGMATVNAAQMRAQEQQMAMQQLMAARQATRESDIDMYRSKQAVNMHNQDNRKDFIGGLMSGAGGMMGGLLG